MNNFRELIVWQKSIDLVVRIYEVTKKFPESEKFNLVSQMQRCGTSIPSNIAEGAGRNSAAYFKQFLTVAIGSAYELETQLVISKKLNYVNEEIYNQLVRDITEVQRMIYGLHGTL
ncbi:MAG: four helix bundle protein [Flavipsychrobacter sp.]|jgi:four helix bundle protein|nr:four helix bundle protein [Flavipsychrobacter sp.]